MSSYVVAVSAIALLAGCRIEQTIVTPDPHLERMLDQQKVRPYEANSALPHGMAMQPPPEGAVPFERNGAPPMLGATIQGHWVERIPVAVDRPLVLHGRQDFETFCAACHGVFGDGTSAVASKMTFRRPKNLLDPDARAYPPGRIFQAVREGYGLMPSYAVQLSERESWGVVAYVRALQMARGARVADLSPDDRVRLAQEAR